MNAHCPAWKHNLCTCQQVPLPFKNYGEVATAIYEKSYFRPPRVTITNGHKTSANFYPSDFDRCCQRSMKAIIKSPASRHLFSDFTLRCSFRMHRVEVFLSAHLQSSLPIISIASFLEWCWQDRTIDVKWLTRKGKFLFEVRMPMFCPVYIANKSRCPFKVKRGNNGTLTSTKSRSWFIFNQTLI